MFFAGCTAGTAQIWIACPVDLVKIKLQTQTAAAASTATPGNVPYYRYFNKLCLLFMFLLIQLNPSLGSLEVHLTW